MGYYIETASAKGKAEVIFRELGGIELSVPPKRYADIPAGKALIVVIDNGPFEAAGFAYDEAEFKVMTTPDGRPARYLLIDRKLAEKYSGYGQD